MHSTLRCLALGMILVSFVLAACGSPAPTPLPKPAATLSVDDIYAGWITWMDNLKTCTPYARSYLNPLIKAQQMDTIEGKDGEVCLVTQETVGRYVLACRYTAEGIATMTRDELYQQAKNHTMSTIENDPSTAVLNTQCKLTMLHTPTVP